jgi:hypothetical protein
MSAASSTVVAASALTKKTVLKLDRSYRMVEYCSGKACFSHSTSSENCYSGWLLV